MVRRVPQYLVLPRSSSSADLTLARARSTRPNRRYTCDCRIVLIFGEMPLELGSSASMWSLAIRLAAGQSMLQHQGISATLRVGLFDMNVVYIYIIISCCLFLLCGATIGIHRYNPPTYGLSDSWS
ncbi:hypothetical protein SORBI_3001G435650 [Sorghum bicolor]|uniref:Uncharacterized protein n=1 Tax=Sorghum bicolor TaxID=4558 RepID=A0A1B6QR49_SORBI|nr:hypothetical protein SORBI_3001G539100 [Sorghum bicolor]OQU92905.1 hypothetical protein SORBI_3001G435650 [Sorghum bicolor]